MPVYWTTTGPGVPVQTYTTTTNTAGWHATYVTKDELEIFETKLYKVIKEHTPIDISEEEFMELLKEG